MCLYRVEIAGARGVDVVRHEKKKTAPVPKVSQRRVSSLCCHGGVIAPGCSIHSKKKWLVRQQVAFEIYARWHPKLHTFRRRNYFLNHAMTGSVSPFGSIRDGQVYKCHSTAREGETMSTSPADKEAGKFMRAGDFCMPLVTRD